MDLPDMLAAKRLALKKFDPDAKVIGIDLFDQAFAEHILALDHSKPLVIISED